MLQVLFEELDVSAVRQHRIVAFFDRLICIEPVGSVSFGEQFPILRGLLEIDLLSQGLAEVKLKQALEAGEDDLVTAILDGHVAERFTVLPHFEIADTKQI